ncbi:ComF family protein [Dichotomicrobium thermohalophilum]|uniref:ComF family protein n=1 Tax=Dichotomicrobium thermohalophilum TaxID=933063 RepID=A0A397Q1I0_9HYPH|nr:ComF family protein [Dichotomicrobium thermohalophilum]RIA55360.1 ComF family protein [Dichotomicrobium thermohalophilum]
MALPSHIERTSGLRSWAAAGLRYLGDLVLPPVCIVCHDPLDRHNALCPRCWNGLRFIRPPLCHRLGLPLPYDAGDQAVSSMALRHPPLYDRARAALAFDGVARELIHAFKYADRHEAVPLFSQWMSDAGRALIAEADVIAPVPLHPWRLLRRRFNQSAVLAGRLARAHDKPMVLGLKRVRYTQQQVGLAFGERRANVEGAFRVPPGRAQALAGKHVLLIDDVITTGATVEACALALKDAGATAVDVLAVARVTDLERPTA